MTTVNSDNVFNIALDCNFDDCQKIVKLMFLLLRMPLKKIILQNKLKKLYVVLKVGLSTLSRTKRKFELLLKQEKVQIPRMI